MDPLWSLAAAWVDVNNDGLLDLFVVNYVQWNYEQEPRCSYAGLSDYCNPGHYKGLPNQLFLNKGDGTFEDVSEAWGIRSHVGKGMGVGVADYDLDGRPDIFVTNDTLYNFFFHNLGRQFEEIAFQTGTALAEDGNFISAMGLDFRDFDNDGYPDLAYVALAKQTFPLLKNKGGKEFIDVTAPSGMRQQSMSMSAFGAALYDFDNDGWKDVFTTRGEVLSRSMPGTTIDQVNTVFRNLGASGKWQAYTGEAGFDASGPARHRGCAFGDLDGDGKVDAVVTALGKNAEIWTNRSRDNAHWLDVALVGTKSNRDGIGAVVKVVTASGTQYNHMTTSACYASSSAGPVHFGLGADGEAQTVEIRWPSGLVQTAEERESGSSVYCEGGGAVGAPGFGCCCWTIQLVDDVPLPLAIIRTLHLVVQRSQFDMWLQPVRFLFHHLFHVLQGVVQLALGALDPGQLKASDGRSGPDLKRPFEMLPGTIQITFRVENRAQGNVGVEVVRIVGERLLKGRDGAWMVGHILQRLALQRVDAGQLRIDGDRRVGQPCPLVRTHSAVVRSGRPAGRLRRCSPGWLPPPPA